MSFNEQLFRKSEQILAERRQKNERLLSKRRSELSEKHPDLLQIERELSQTFTVLIGLIFSKDKEFSRKLSDLERRNLLLQDQLHEKLAAYGYPENYLDTPHDCPLCRDTGIVDGRRCSCVMQIVKRLASEELNRVSPLNLCRFSDFKLDYYDNKNKVAFDCTAREIMTQNLSFCKTYADGFRLPFKSVFMLGGTGLGKTHLSLCIANEVLSKGFTVIYGSAPELFRKVEQEHFGRSEGDTASALQEAQLLILDDLGAEFESKFYTAALYGILNNRLSASLPTIINSNCNFPELNRRYGERITSRLASMERLLFVGKDIRIQKGGF